MGYGVGLWWDDSSHRWIFGLVGTEGQSIGVGYNDIHDVFCPHEFFVDCHYDRNCTEKEKWLAWALLDGNDFLQAERAVAITCK